MTATARECSTLHTRLLKCTLEVEHSRAYWRHMADHSGPVAARTVHEQFWFGARSLERTGILLTNFRARYDAFPGALPALRSWDAMDPLARRLLCHWHLQLSDPLYRRFAGDYLVERRRRVPAEVSHGPVVKWVAEQGGERWGMGTRVQFASKLLTSALAAGLIGSSRDPRPLLWPRVDDLSLAYLLYLLRETEFQGSLLANPYLASIGLCGTELEKRLKTLPGLRFRRQGDLIDFGWVYPDLVTWAEIQFARPHAVAVGGAR
ncbi:DUF1819 domain-containing protein [uncultured Lamprocystis sp.]|jgi:hypothetical protein|uniref:DUF1819 domain-containing protein n=1 Tax=uncultured Lamprocystis sp. TaxID=543132 RepID=UPI0025D09E5F|nr:DUF1819 domain-containing protein [uncultured Lamprocystis sp.]